MNVIFIQYLFSGIIIYNRFKQTHDISEGCRITFAVRRGLLKLQPGFSTSWCTAIIIRYILSKIFRVYSLKLLELSL